MEFLLRVCSGGIYCIILKFLVQIYEIHFLAYRQYVYILFLHRIIAYKGFCFIYIQPHTSFRLPMKSPSPPSPPPLGVNGMWENKMHCVEPDNAL